MLYDFCSCALSELTYPLPMSIRLPLGFVTCESSTTNGEVGRFVSSVGTSALLTLGVAVMLLIPVIVYFDVPLSAMDAFTAPMLTFGMFVACPIPYGPKSL